MNEMLRKFSIWLLVAILAGAIVYLIIDFAKSRPPQEFTIATGREGGAYYEFAQQYKAIVAERGYTLHVLPTAGSVETLELLLAGTADVGYVQSGTTNQTSTEGLASLASLFYEPLWIFYRLDSFAEAPTILGDLSTARIGIGEEGSGANQSARFLMEVNGINEEGAEFRTGSATEQVRQLEDGELDAAIFVSSPEAPVIMSLLTNEELALLGIRRQLAYTSRYSGVSSITLGEGTIDLARNIPPEDVPLISAAAVLVATEDFHPDLARLLLVAATEVHAPGGIFEKPGEFPSQEFVEIPMSADAARFLENGPTGLERYLPFWLASRLERILFLWLPVLLLLYPLFRGTPLAVQFVIRFRIARWYQMVREIEQELENYKIGQVDEKIASLEDIQQQLTENFRIPRLYLESFYNLRLHLNLVIQRLHERRVLLSDETYDGPDNLASAEHALKRPNSGLSETTH